LPKSSDILQAMAFRPGTLNGRLSEIEHEIMQYRAQWGMQQQELGMTNGPGGAAFTQTSAFMQSSPAPGPGKDHKELLDFNHKLMGMYTDLMNQNMNLMSMNQKLVAQQAAGGAAKAKAAAGGGNAGQTAAACLGVIRLDYDYPPAPGDIDSPQSFAYDVFYRVVPGFTFAMCMAGQLTPAVEKEFLEAVDWLVGKGVSGITGDCGFMMYFQQLARRHTTKPVFMSSLAQLPAVTCAFSQHDLIGVFTANGNSLRPMRDLIKEECGVDPEERRYIIVGFQDVPGFDAVAKGEKVNVAKCTPGIVEAVKATLMLHPKIRAILLECTELPPYSDAIRAATGLPVYDSITCCNFFISGLQDNERFGINNWQKDWDGEQADYTYGQNLDAGDRSKLVNKMANPNM